MALNLKFRWKLFRLEMGILYRIVGFGFDKNLADYKRITAEYPIASRIVVAVAWLVTLYDDRLHPWRLRYRRFENWIFKGPLPIFVSTLDRRAYHERDDIILHAMFQILVDFVEREVCWESDNAPKKQDNKRHPEIGVAWLRESADPLNKEILYLYEWWTKIRRDYVGFSDDISEELAARLFPNEPEEFLGRKIYGMSSTRWDFQYAVDNEMLIRLIAIRDRLWT